MAKLHHVKKAAKAYRRFGIKKGQEYWWIKFARCAKQYFATKPKPSQCVRSKYERNLLLLGESLDNDCGVDNIRGAAEAVAELVEEMEDKKAAIAERFPNGCPTMELLEERIEHCTGLVEQLREAARGLEEFYDVAGEDEGDGDYVQPPNVLEGIDWL